MVYEMLKDSDPLCEHLKVMLSMSGKDEATD